MRLIRLGVALLCSGALAACSTVGNGSHGIGAHVGTGAHVGSGSHDVTINPRPDVQPDTPPLVCRPGEQLVILAGVPRCV